MATKVSSNPDSGLKRKYRRIESDIEVVADTIVIDGVPAEMVHNFLGVQFFADSLGAVPATPGAGTATVTVSTVNSDGAVKATGILTGTTIADTNTVTIDGKVYTFQAALTDVDGNVLVGASDSDSLDNLIAAINKASGGGTTYAASTPRHSSVSAAVGAGDTMVASALEAGTPGNALATTASLDAGSWAGGTLSGGTDGVFESPPDNAIDATAPTIVTWDANTLRVSAVPAGITVATHWKAVWTGNGD